MDIARCLLVFKGDLPMWNGMNEILSITPNVEVNIISQVSEAALIDEIQASTPNVVVLEDAFVIQDPGVISRLQTLREGLRVIVVSLDDNSLQVYDHQTLRVRKYSDFISAITSKTGPLAD